MINNKTLKIIQYITCFLTLTGPAVQLISADNDDKLPAQVVAINDKLLSDIRGLKRKAVTELEKIKIEFTKRGDLNTAIKIKNEIDKLSDEIDNPAALKNNKLLERIIGIWRLTTGQLVEITKDGKILNPWNEPWTYEISGDIITFYATGSSAGVGPYKMKLLSKELVFTTSKGIDKWVKVEK